MMRQDKDNKGRIICVEAKINGININLCNLYGLNTEEPSFFYNTNKILDIFIGWTFNYRRGFQSAIRWDST